MASHLTPSQLINHKNIYKCARTDIYNKQLKHGSFNVLLGLFTLA